jgi:hypothetical protein
MKTHQITGVGPQAADGSVDLFTVRAQPFHVTKEWLDAQAAYPSVGNEIVEAEDGSLSLTTDAALAGVTEDAQKKTMIGSEGSDTGLPASSLPTYASKATTITAGMITGVATGSTEPGFATVTLEDGTTRKLPAGNICGVGDYWCTDGAYEWFMPVAMFKDKFEA